MYAKARQGRNTDVRGKWGGSRSKNNLINLDVVCPEIADENSIVSGYDDANGFNEYVAPKFRQGFAVWRKDLHPPISAVGDIKGVPAVQANLVRFSELPERRAFAPPYLDEIGAEVILFDPVVARVDDIDVSIGVDNEARRISKLFVLAPETSAN